MIKLIFVHIPKAAGISFAEALRHVYGPEYNAYRPLRIRPEEDDLLYTDYDARKVTWDRAMDRLPPDINWLTDHVPVQLYDGLFPGVPRIAWLRDPVHRVISAYIHDWAHRIIKPDIGIREYINLDRKRNLMTFFTASGDLGRFSFVGIVERFNQDLARLARLLDWPPGYPVAYINQCLRPGLKEELLSDSALVSEIERLNQQDRELYTRATEKEI